MLFSIKAHIFTINHNRQQLIFAEDIYDDCGKMELNLNLNFGVPRVCFLAEKTDSANIKRLRTTDPDIFSPNVEIYNCMPVHLLRFCISA